MTPGFCESIVQPPNWVGHFVEAAVIAVISSCIYMPVWISLFWFECNIYLAWGEFEEEQWGWYQGRLHENGGHTSWVKGGLTMILWPYNLIPNGLYDLPDLFLQTLFFQTSTSCLQFYTEITNLWGVWFSLLRCWNAVYEGNCLWKLVWFLSSPFPSSGCFLACLEVHVESLFWVASS